jgi:DNA polymerase
VTFECIFDFETRSPEPISYGTDKYTTQSQPILLSWTLLDTDRPAWDPPVELHDWTATDDPQLPREFEYILKQQDVPLVAHACPFDRAQLLSPLRAWTPYLPVTRFRCTRAQAYAHGLPGALEVLPAVLGLPPETVKFSEVGHRMIHLFCVPYGFYENERGDSVPHYHDRHSHPVEWAEFCGYAKQDTYSLRAVRRALPTVNYQANNLATWWLDQMINNRGFGFDVELAEAARELLEKGKARMRPKITAATGGALEMPTQRAKLLAWLETKGIVAPNMRAATVRELLDADDLDPIVRFVLEARLEASKSSGAKYGKGLNAQVGGRLRHCIMFSGAGRTGRFSHKIFQPGNMMRPVADGAGKNEGKTVPVPAEFCLEVLVPAIKRGLVLNEPLLYGEPHSAAANALRCAIIAAPGNELLDADYAGVEARGAAWLSGEEWLLESYRAQDRGEGADSYKLLVHRFFGIPMEEINNHWRQIGKVVRLAFQYGAGVGGLVTMAAQYNMDLDAIARLVLGFASPEQLKKADKMWRKAFLGGQDFGLEPDTYRACDVLKQVYREAEKRVTQVRYDIDKAVTHALENPGQAFYAARSTMFYAPGCLAIVLPSGRRLLYWRPEYIQIKEIDPETLEESSRKTLTFMTPRGKGWIKEKAWNGLFFNNIDQGTCADILRDGLRAVHTDTLTVPEIARYLATLPPEQRTAICLHVHDAITADVPRGSYSLERMTNTMVTASPWAKGFPLAASGWVGPRYHYK